MSTKIIFSMGLKGDENKVVKTVISNKNPFSILLGQAEQFGPFEEPFPNIVEDTYLPGPIFLLGLPFPLIFIDPETGNYDLMIHYNEKLTFASHASSELKWLDRDGQPISGYLDATDLCEAQLPFKRYIEGRPLELSVDLLYARTETIELPSDIEPDKVTRVSFPTRWDEKGKLQTKLKIYTFDGTTYVITQRCLPYDECLLLEDMCKSALDKTSDPGFRQANSISLSHLTNYYKTTLI